MQKRNKKILLIAVIMIVELFELYRISIILSSGSYSFEDVYEINAPEEEVIKAIKQFKTLHPDFVVPKVTIDGKSSSDLSEEEGRKDISYWYYNYFYFQNENQI